MGGVAVLVAVLAGLVVGAGCGNDSPADGDDDATVGQTTTLDPGADSPEATSEPTSIEDLNKLPALRKADEDDTLPAIRGSAGLSLPQWLHTVDGDIVAFWHAAFNARGAAVLGAQGDDLRSAGPDAVRAHERRS
jgi:hypothetical protein